MAIISDCQEEKPQRQTSLSTQERKPPLFTATLDPSNPLEFIRSALDFVSNESDFFKTNTAGKSIMAVVNDLRESMAARQKEAAMAKKDAETMAMAEKKSNYIAPNEGNGLDLDNYSWTQSLQEVSVNVPVPFGTKSKLIVCDIEMNHLKVGIKGQPPIIDGELYNSVKPDECFWSLDVLFNAEDQKSVSILLTKINQVQWWRCFIKGEPEIDTQKVEPEKSSLSDLEPEQRTAVERTMFDRKQKALGRPTSDQIEEQETLKKFIAQLPDMKINYK